MVLVGPLLAYGFQADVPGICLCRGFVADFGLGPAPAQTEGVGNPPPGQLDGRTHAGLGSGLDAVAAVAGLREKLPRGACVHAARPAEGSWLRRQPESW